MSERDKQIIKEFIKKNWNYNWADFRSQEFEAEWLHKYTQFYKQQTGLLTEEFLRKFSKEMEKDETD